MVDGVKAGCCAFETHVDFAEDGDIVPAAGVLYIATTGILPRYQGQGLGAVLKSWQVAYARRHGFQRMVTSSRASNAAMIALNGRFGFQIARRIEGYYTDPLEAAVVMEWTRSRPCRLNGDSASPLGSGTPR